MNVDPKLSIWKWPCSHFLKNIVTKLVPKFYIFYKRYGCQMSASHARPHKYHYLHTWMTIPKMLFLVIQHLSWLFGVITIYLLDPGKARGCFLQTLLCLIDCLIGWLIIFLNICWNALQPNKFELEPEHNKSQKK